jgi:nitric oxide reductase subunit B
MLPLRPTPSQRATLKYFIVVSLLFLMPVMIGGGVAHYRADATGFYGIDISGIFPSQLLRTWSAARDFVDCHCVSGWRLVHRAVTRRA